MLSLTSEYALRAVISIARHGPGPVRVETVAARVGAPRVYLAKILSQLARAGILDSLRGPAGGFSLAVNPERLNLAQIVSVFATDEERRCLLGTGACGHVPECPAHRRWAPIARELDGFFAHTTVAELLSPDRSSAVPAAGSLTDSIAPSTPVSPAGIPAQQLP